MWVNMAVCVCVCVCIDVWVGVWGEGLAKRGTAAHLNHMLIKGVFPPMSLMRLRSEAGEKSPYYLCTFACGRRATRFESRRVYPPFV